MMLVMKMDLVYATGKEVSSFVLYTRCGHPSAHPLPLMSPLRFYLRNVRYPSLDSKLSEGKVPCGMLYCGVCFIIYNEGMYIYRLGM